MSRPHLHFTSLTPRELCGDIVESYRLAAERLGYPTSYDDRTFQPGVINVLFFFWDVPWETIEPYHPDCIVVNFEPMVSGTHAWRDNYLGVLKQCYLWEYSQSNFQRASELNLRIADYVPLAYEEDAALVLPLDQVLPDAEQDIDVVFFGTMTARRTAVLGALINRGLRMAYTNGGESWSIEERDDYLRRAKVVLNLHNWENSRVVEVGRLSILFRQRKAVVCELYPDSELEPLLRGAVVAAPYDRLVDTVLELLADAPRRAALERAGLPLLERLSQAARVGPALDRFLQWRDQQRPLPDAGLSVAVGATVEAWTQDWARTFSSLAASTLRPELAICTSPMAEAQVRDELEKLNLNPPHLLVLPPEVDALVGRNWAQQVAQAEAILFCAPGDHSLPQRLERLSAFLASQPDLEIATHWLAQPGDETGTQAPVRTPELDHEIKAELLGPQPLPLARCLLRLRFLRDHGLRHDPELGRHAGLHFLSKCAAAGARFGTLAQPLYWPADDEAAVDDADADARLSARARRPWLRAAFPHLTQDEIVLLGELQSRLWAANPDFAKRLLFTLARACEQAPEALGTERETLSRVLRSEARRLLKVFHESSLIDQAWIDACFEDAQVARFLSPLGTQLPLRPTPEC